MTVDDLGFKYLRLCAVVCIALTLVGCGGHKEKSSDPRIQALINKCASIKGQTINGVTVTDANRIAANSRTNPAGLCQVLGTRAPFLDIEVDLPDNWSGRLLHQGGGALDGIVFSAISRDSLGFVVGVNSAITQQAAIYAASNGGNRALTWDAAPLAWVGGTADSEASANDFAYQALGTTIDFAKRLANEFYAASPTRTYFNGCSEGGREAYMVAQRWPNEYDGIVQGCATMDVTGTVSGIINAASVNGTSAELSDAQYAASYASAVAACDASDGLVDGYLANPRGCTAATIDPGSMQCGQFGANPNPLLCLSAAQVGTLRTLLSDLMLNTGAIAYSKYPWTDFSQSGAPTSTAGILAGAFAVLATDDLTWITPLKQATFDLNRDYYVFKDGFVNRGVENDKNAIAAFVASGKKLLSWSDAGDPLISANDHARNHATMTAIATSLGLADPRVNTRLFMVPASTHAAGHDFADIDWFGAIIDWVENNHAPVRLNYSFQAGGTTRTLPVCEYPTYPHYNGSGNTFSAASFTCIP